MQPLVRYHVLATDYDGTLANAGEVHDDTRAALARLRGSGRKVVLVTGRMLPALAQVCHDLTLFDLVVAENGAVLYCPTTGTRTLLGKAPPPAFIERLRALGVSQVEMGAVIVAGARAQAKGFEQAIRELGLALELSLNRDAAMVLPVAVNKASGLVHALAALGYSRHEVVAVGDAENDQSFLAFSGCGVAVQNALPALAACADGVTRGSNGAGVRELIDRLLADDLSGLSAALVRHGVPLGRSAEAAVDVLPAQGSTLLVAGSSARETSALLAAFTRQLAARDYQFCLFDPDGAHGALPRVAMTVHRVGAPSVAAVLAALQSPELSLGVDLSALEPGQQEGFLQALLPGLERLRLEKGRPHFLIVDAAERGSPRLITGGAWPAWTTVLVSAHAEEIAASSLQQVDRVLACGAAPAETLAAVAARLAEDLPRAGQIAEFAPGDALLWRRSVPDVLSLRQIFADKERPVR